MAAKKASAAKKSALSATSANQVTQLTPNSNCIASGTGDANNTTNVAFDSPQNVFTWWTGTVSSSLKTATLGADMGNAIVTFQKGMTLTYQASGTSGAYNVFMNGNILDNGNLYTFTGAIVYQSSGAATGTVSVKKA